MPSINIKLDKSMIIDKENLPRKWTWIKIIRAGLDYAIKKIKSPEKPSEK
jgi:hypothetical protein